MKAKQSVEKNILSPTARTLIKQAKQEERDTFKAQVRKEIEEKRRPGICDGAVCYCDGEPEDDCEVFEYNSAIDDCLSIPSLKEEEE